MTTTTTTVNPKAKKHTKKQFRKKANLLDILKVNVNEEIQIWEPIFECLLCVRSFWVLGTSRQQRQNLC